MASLAESSELRASLRDRKEHTLDTTSICRELISGFPDLRLVDYEFRTDESDRYVDRYPLIIEVYGQDPLAQSAQQLGCRLADTLGMGVTIRYSYQNTAASFARVTREIFCSNSRGFWTKDVGEPTESIPPSPLSEANVAAGVAFLLRELGLDSGSKKLVIPSPSFADLQVSLDSWYRAKAPGQVVPIITQRDGLVVLSVDAVASPWHSVELVAARNWLASVGERGVTPTLEITPSLETASHFVAKTIERRCLWTVETGAAYGTFVVTVQPLKNELLSIEDRLLIESCLRLGLGRTVQVNWCDTLAPGVECVTYPSNVNPETTGKFICESANADLAVLKKHPPSCAFISSFKLIGDAIVIYYIDVGEGPPQISKQIDLTSRIVAVATTKKLPREALCLSMIAWFESRDVGPVEIRTNGDHLSISCLDVSQDSAEKAQQVREIVEKLKVAQPKFEFSYTFSEDDKVYDSLLRALPRDIQFALSQARRGSISKIRTNRMLSGDEQQILSKLQIDGRKFEYDATPFSPANNAKYSEPFLLHPGYPVTRTLETIRRDREVLEQKLNILVPAKVEIVGTSLVAVLPNYVPEALELQITTAIGHHDSPVSVVKAIHRTWTAEEIAKAIPYSAPQSTYLRSWAISGTELQLACFFDPQEIDAQSAKQRLQQLKGFGLRPTVSLSPLSPEAAKVLSEATPRQSRLLAEVLLPNEKIRDDLQFEILFKRMTETIVKDVPYRTRAIPRRRVNETIIASDDTVGVMPEDFYSARELDDGSIEVSCHHVTPDLIARGSVEEFQLLINLTEAAYPINERSSRSNQVGRLIERALVTKRTGISELQDIPAVTVVWIVDTYGQKTAKEAYPSLLPHVTRLTNGSIKNKACVAKAVAATLDLLERAGGRAVITGQSLHDPFGLLGRDSRLVAAELLQRRSVPAIYASDIPIARRHRKMSSALARSDVWGGNSETLADRIRREQSLGARPSLDVVASEASRLKFRSSDGGEIVEIGGPYRKLASARNLDILAGAHYTKEEMRLYVDQFERSSRFQNQIRLEQSVALEVIRAGVLKKSGEAVSAKLFMSNQNYLLLVTGFDRPIQITGVPTAVRKQINKLVSVKVVNYNPIQREVEVIFVN